MIQRSLLALLLLTAGPAYANDAAHSSDSEGEKIFMDYDEATLDAAYDLSLIHI